MDNEHNPNCSWIRHIQLIYTIGKLSDKKSNPIRDLVIQLPHSERHLATPELVFSLLDAGYPMDELAVSIFGKNTDSLAFSPVFWMIRKAATDKYKHPEYKELSCRIQILNRELSILQNTISVTGKQIRRLRVIYDKMSRYRIFGERELSLLDSIYDSPEVSQYTMNGYYDQLCEVNKNNPVIYKASSLEKEALQYLDAKVKQWDQKKELLKELNKRMRPIARKRNKFIEETSTLLFKEIYPFIWDRLDYSEGALRDITRKFLKKKEIEG